MKELLGAYNFLFLDLDAVSKNLSAELHIYFIYIFIEMLFPGLEKKFQKIHMETRKIPNSQSILQNYSNYHSIELA